MPTLWKEDIELGIAYFCPHCKVFQCSGKGQCTKCSGEIDWNRKIQYLGKVKWE